MSGSNGLRPVENLAERRKCPLHPTKAKFSEAAAIVEADLRSKRTKLNIEPYLCEGCGFWHLTKNSHGTVGKGGKYSTGEFKAVAPNHPVFSGEPAEVDETDDEGLPLVPGDFDTRVRFARAFLEENPEPTSEQMCAHLGGCTKDSLRKVMHHLGYHNTRGRTARWVKDEAPTDEPPMSAADLLREQRHRQGRELLEVEVDDRTPLDLSYDNDAPETSMRWHGGRDIQWREARVVENTDRIRHVALGDLLDTYAAAGFRLVLSLEVADA